MRIFSHKSSFFFFSTILFFAITIFLFPFLSKAEKQPDFTGSSILKNLSFPGSIAKYSGLSGTIESITIPLKRAGRLFLLEAHIDEESGNFIFDTGAADLVLNSTYFRKYITMDLEEGQPLVPGQDWR